MAFVLIEGSGILELAEEEDQAIRGPCVVWLPEKASGTVRIAAGSSGATTRLGALATNRSIPQGPATRSIREGLRYGLLGLRLEEEQARRLSSILADTSKELEMARLGSAEAVRLNLGLLLLAIWRLSRPRLTENMASPRAIVHGFVNLVDHRSREHWTVSRYAEELGVSVDRLSSAVRRATGQSPLAHIHARVLNEAIAMLNETRLQVAEIAEALGFPDAGYFNRFFRRMTGEPPGRFRRRAGASRRTTDKSFAAWP